MDNLGTSMTDELFITRTADFSLCRTWRYTLIRTWDVDKPSVLFILLNPSTADEVHDDHTNRRGIGYAMDWGFGGVTFCNLFAVRTPEPKIMMQAPDPVGPDNDTWIKQEIRKAGKVVAAWGAHGAFKNRDLEVRQIFKSSGVRVSHLGLTKYGHPKHILYLGRSVPLQEYNP